jgi:hypothetical protein
MVELCAAADADDVGDFAVARIELCTAASADERGTAAMHVAASPSPESSYA